MDKMPVFVKVEEYSDVLTIIKSVRKKIDDAKSTLLKINELKNEEDHQIELWQTSLSEIEKKVDFIDRSLSEPESF